MNQSKSSTKKFPNIYMQLAAHWWTPLPCKTAHNRTNSSQIAAGAIAAFGCGTHFSYQEHMGSRVDAKHEAKRIKLDWLLKAVNQTRGFVCLILPNLQIFDQGERQRT